MPKSRIDSHLNKHFESIDEKGVQDYFTNVYDEVLGWNNKPLTSRTAINAIGQSWTSSYEDNGARQSSFKDKPLLANSYGDSFTHGDEVDNEQTWQYFLSQLTDKNVANFGVGAYGTDQSFLKLKEHFEKNQGAPITILVIFEGDVTRIFTNFRAFLEKDTGIKLGFKPRFEYKNGNVHYVANPLRRNMNLKEIKKLAFDLSEGDPAVERNLFLLWDFPYTFQLKKLIVKASRIFQGKFFGKDYQNEWQSKEGRPVVEFLIEDFIRTSCSHNSLPILVLIPDTNRWLKEKKITTYNGFKEEFLVRRFQDLILVDIAKEDFDEEKFTLIPYRGHLSAYGNQTIARAIFDSINPIIGQEDFPKEKTISEKCESLTRNDKD